METVSSKLKHTFENKYVYGAVVLVAILYAGVAAPKLPPDIAKLFDQNLFKLIVLFVIAYISTSDIRVALILSIGFIVSIQSLNKISIEDQMKSWIMYTNEREILSKRNEGMNNISQQTKQVVMPPKVISSTGYETGTLESGCYGGVTGTVGYDSADNLSAYQ